MESYRNGFTIGSWDEVAALFATFSRFEYGLKRAGFLKYNEVGSKAEANWDQFASSLGEDFYASCKNDTKLTEFFEFPPQLLKVSSNDPLKLCWMSEREISNGATLFQSVRDVRNSLFHGEKDKRVERDQRLVGFALRILDTAFSFAASSTDERLTKFTRHFRW